MEYFEDLHFSAFTFEPEMVKVPKNTSGKSFYHVILLLKWLYKNIKYCWHQVNWNKDLINMTLQPV